MYPDTGRGSTAVITAPEVSQLPRFENSSTTPARICSRREQLFALRHHLIARQQKHCTQDGEEVQVDVLKLALGSAKGERSASEMFTGIMQTHGHAEKLVQESAQTISEMSEENSTAQAKIDEQGLYLKQGKKVVDGLMKFADLESVLIDSFVEIIQHRNGGYIEGEACKTLKVKCLQDVEAIGEENLSVLTSLLSKYFTERLQDESSFLSKMVQLNEAFHVDFNSQTIVHDKRCNFATAAWLVFMYTAPVEASIAEMTPLVNNGYVFKPSFVHGEIPWIPGKGMFNVVLLRVHLRSMRSDDDAFLM